MYNKFNEEQFKGKFIALKSYIEREQIPEVNYLNLQPE